MGELIAPIKVFLTRDVTFIIGGASVIGAFYYWLNPMLDMKPHSPASYFVVLGLCHFTGFALESLGQFVRLVNVATLPNPGRFIRSLYRSLTRKETWYPADPLVDARFAQYADERSQAEIDRIITLKQIAATMGACSAIVCLIIIGKCITQHAITLLDAAVVTGFGFLSFIFSPLSYVISAEQVQFVAEKTLPERIRLRAYFIWETDKEKLPEVCWTEARQVLLDEAKEALARREIKRRAD